MKITVVLLLLLLSLMLAARELSETDMLHLYVAGGAFISGQQALEFAGINRDTAEAAMLAAGVICIYCKEQYDRNNGGAATKEDIELGITGLISGFLVNRAINKIWRSKNEQKKS